jgi:hypothetical protein
MRRLSLILASALLPILISCGGGSVAAPPPPPPEPGVTVSPATASVPAGATQQFTANVVGVSNTAVTWQVEGVAGGNATTGTISTTGLYTAPTVPPPGGSVTVTAVLQADPELFGSALVAVQFSNVSFSGAYVFNFIGTDQDGVFTLAGRFEADGDGNLTNGLQDLNHATGIVENLAFTGTYSISPSGRGFVTLTSDFGTFDFRIILTDRAGRALLISFDPATNGSGVIIMEGASAAVVANDFVFRLEGVSDLGAIALAGRYTQDGAGIITDGVLDANNNGVPSENSPFTGTFADDASGRRTVSLVTALGPLTLRLYPSTSDSFLAVSLDVIPAVAGEVAPQSLDQFADTDLTGNYVFQSIGFSADRVTASAGRFTADGAGNITAGLFDENDTGIVRETVPFSGMYAVAPNGRSTFTLISDQETLSFAFYLAGARGFFVRLDPDLTAAGEFQSQAPGPFSAASFGGSLGLLLTGVFGDLESDLLARLSSDGAGNLAGLTDANIFGDLFEALSVTGTYNVSSTGRGTLALNIGGEIFNSRFYLADETLQFFVGVDPTEVLGGRARRQF